VYFQVGHFTGDLLKKLFLIFVVFSTLDLAGCAKKSNTPSYPTRGASSGNYESDSLTDPYISSVFPNFGNISGGSQITIAGSNFHADASFTVGGKPCKSLGKASYYAGTCIAQGAAQSGRVDIQVSNPDGRAYTAQKIYFFQADYAQITRISPLEGPENTLLHIYGTSFEVGAAVTIGGSPALSVQVLSPTEMTCLTPAGTSNAARVFVTNPGHHAEVGYSTVIYKQLGAAIPPSPAVAPVAFRVTPVFGVYANSEAEALQIAYAHRMSAEHHEDSLDEVSLLDLGNEISDAVIGALDDSTSLQSQLREFSVEHQNYIHYIQDKMNLKMAALTLSSPTSPHVNPPMYRLCDDKLRLSEILNAIQNNQEEAFVSSALDLVNQLPLPRQSIGRALSGALSVLFVTKQFESEGVRRRYYRYLLGGGQIR
jgi:hypothetical protein